jgi:predicted RNase H-like nuclease (RuvC/YqgF family)
MSSRNYVRSFSDPLDDSDSEGHLLVEQELQTAKSEVDQLRWDNLSLRAQLERSVGMTQCLEEMHEKNSDLSATVRSLQNEKSDLIRRLDIAVRSINELTSRIADERHASAQQRIRDAAACDQDRAIFQARYQEKVDLFELQLKTAEETTEKHRIANRVLENKIVQVTKAASLFFGQTFTDVETVIDVLKQAPSRTEVSIEEYDHVLSKLKRRGRLLRDSQSEISALKMRVSELELELTAAAPADSRIVDDLNARNESLRIENAGLWRQFKRSSDADSDTDLRPRGRARAGRARGDPLDAGSQDIDCEGGE